MGDRNLRSHLSSSTSAFGAKAGSPKKSGTPKFKNNESVVSPELLKQIAKLIKDSEERIISSLNERFEQIENDIVILRQKVNDLEGKVEPLTCFPDIIYKKDEIDEIVTNIVDDISESCKYELLQRINQLENAAYQNDLILNNKDHTPKTNV